MQSVGNAHPHALPGVLHAPPGMPLPAAGPRDAPRGDGGAAAWFDVFGGVCFAFFVAIVCVQIGSRLISGPGWVPMIAWESVWLVGSMACAPLLPSVVRHEVSWHTTRDGLLLAWPAIAYALWMIGMYSAYVGELRLDPGPVGLSIAVGTAEEFAFRVLLLGWLASRLPAASALVISSVVFGLAHVHGWSDLSLGALLAVAPQTSLGFLFGAVYLRTRNPLASIVTHAVWDFPYFMAMGLGVFGGGAAAAALPSIGSLVPWIALTVYGLWLVRDGVPLAGRITPVAHR